MAAPVYSTLFIAADGFTISTGYVVPAGFVAVVRDCTIYIDGSLANTAADVRDLATGAFVFYHLMSTQNDYAHWVGHQVFPAGAEIHASSAGPNSAAIRVSGYLLTLP